MSVLVISCLSTIIRLGLEIGEVCDAGQLVTALNQQMSEKKVVGRPFQPGQSGNPLGRKLENKDMKTLRHLTHAEIANVGKMVINGNVEEIQRMAKDPNSTGLQVWMCTIALKGINDGDMTKLDGLLNRIVGKTKTEIILTPAEQAQTPDPKNIDAIEARFTVLKQKMIGNGTNT